MFKRYKLFFGLAIFLFSFSFAIQAHADFIKKHDMLVNTDGGYATGALTLLNGKFYGLTNWSGVSGFGTIFSWDPNTNIVTVVHNFDDANGSAPYGSLTAYQGKLYGMTNEGGSIDCGPSNCGVLFEFNPTGNVYTVLRHLDSPDGTRPNDGTLVLNGDKLYGFNTKDGANGYGTLFVWDLTNSTYTVLHDFDQFTGTFPISSATIVGNKLYAIAGSNGNGFGTFFEYDLNTNIYTSKYTMDTAYYPKGYLSEYNGKFYGTTLSGLISGTIFEWDPNTNIFSVKYTFDSSGPGGSGPYASLTLSGDKFYGVTRQGGANGYGTIFEWDPNTNVYTVLYDFDNTNGSQAYGSLTLSNNILYGITSEGGVDGAGVIYQYTLPVLNVAPVASSVSTSGTAQVGNTLTGIYTYSDADLDAEGTSTFRWLRDGVAITGATSITYTLVSDDANKIIKFEVTPVASTGTASGIAVESSGTSISPAPIINRGHPPIGFINRPTPVSVPVVNNTPVVNNKNPTNNTFTTPINFKTAKTEVKSLQSILNTFLTKKLTVDGIFGKQTISAIKSFQKSKGLVVDGIVGPKTREKLNEMVR